MERAKAIKEQRELARELSTLFLITYQPELEMFLIPLDDVLEYERKAGASGSNRRQSTKAKHSVGELDTEDEAQESGESDKSQSPVVKRKVPNYTISESPTPVTFMQNTASRSIMAYLANQSSGED